MTRFTRLCRAVGVGLAVAATTLYTEGRSHKMVNYRISKFMHIRPILGTRAVIDTGH